MELQGHFKCRNYAPDIQYGCLQTVVGEALNSEMTTENFIDRGALGIQIEEHGRKVHRWAISSLAGGQSSLLRQGNAEQLRARCQRRFAQLFAFAKYNFHGCIYLPWQSMLLQLIVSIRQIYIMHMNFHKLVRSSSCDNTIDLLFVCSDLWIEAR